MRYRAGWLIPKQLLALTHFVPDVSQEDFMGISSDTMQALNDVDGRFHLLIDNRIIHNTDLAPLAGMLGALPYLNHPQLSNIVMVIPEASTERAASIADQTQGHITLHHVDTLEDAYAYFREVDSVLNWESQDKAFFLNA